jgi:hypothetical protein
MKHPDLSHVKIYTKQEIAEQQLDRAILLLLDEKDIVSAITLAGAAEEIISRLLVLQNKTSALTDLINEYENLGKIIDHKLEAGEFIKTMNFFRNEMKHHNKGLDRMPIPAEAAYEIINRAAENIWRLTGNQSEQVLRFNSQICEA